MVEDIDVLLDVVFVICMSNKCGYLVRNGFVMYMRNMYGKTMRDIICKMYKRYIRW